MYYLDQDNFWRDDLDDREVMVSIRCITYNHENYIRDALEGFIMQKTNFRIEVIVHDDASTDRTAAIIREYAEKYPSIIKPIFETENQYSKRDGSLRRIMNDHMRGKYFALCEGDDYWTDPLKIQKQVDFLESHPDFSMVFHKAKVETSVESDCHLYDHVVEKEYFGNEIIEKWTVPTCSVVYKKKIQDLIPFDKRFIYGDIVIFLTCASFGRIYCLNNTMSTYRRTNSGVVYSMRQDEKNDVFQRKINHYLALEKHFPKFKYSIREPMMLQICSALKYSILHLNIKSLNYYFLRGIKIDFVAFCKTFLYIIPIRKIKNHNI